MLLVVSPRHTILEGLFGQLEFQNNVRFESILSVLLVSDKCNCGKFNILNSANIMECKRYFLDSYYVESDAFYNHVVGIFIGMSIWLSTF